MVAKIANTKTPLHMDFGIGDVIVPESEMRIIMTQLDDFENKISLDSILIHLRKIKIEECRR